ncbi:hypothetical protein GSU3527 [Geobacter sulfurreducens PCA]|uniref:Uncharacterized protein n=1 Tax=Geobacter sulfurreducens (strain ATCC 51573 / DSM 12127 / PCA) TaxID=243231 RepID=I7EP56_GEOSL|nr:hypothetical protein GSU3527 [Geobacter sulfurreducens PCA]AJY71970.1 hypothetical protein RW64_16320 [Geobacter sulfurreducens]HBB69628.1 hypothetical protein [Geobacter sulfurreducens]HCD95508.1 hypothetical protein [Geobacter sulfurreducens]
MSAIQVGTPSRGRMNLLSTIQNAKKPSIYSSSCIVAPPLTILSDSRIIE